MTLVFIAAELLSQPAFAVEPPTKICGRIEQLSDTFRMEYGGLEGVYLELLDDQPKDPKKISAYLTELPSRQLNRCHCLSGRSRVFKRASGELAGSWIELSSLTTCDGKPER